jgi:DNA-binding GntR family transcriptional regulator
MAQARPNQLSTQLAMQIAGLVRKQGLPAGAHVTEQMIVEAFHVSRSPVRKAMSFLESMGVLSGEKNRGYFLKKTGRALERIAASSSATNGDALYLRVADDRFRGELDDEVSEAEIARRYRITRAQTLQILHRMGREGLVTRKPGRGWKFQPTLDTPEAHDESYRFRMIIEPAAVLEPAYRVDVELFARLRREQQAMLDGDIFRLSRARLFQVGAEFHEAIVACSGNRFLLDAIRRQNQLRRLIEYKGNVNRKRLVRQCREHLKLLGLLESDRQAAAAFLKHHIDYVRAIKTGMETPNAASGSELLDA